MGTAPHRAPAPATRQRAATVVAVGANQVGRRFRRQVDGVTLTIRTWDRDSAGRVVGFHLDVAGGAAAVNVKAGRAVYPADPGRWRSPDGSDISDVFITIGSDIDTIIHLPAVSPGPSPGSEASTPASH